MAQRSSLAFLLIAGLSASAAAQLPPVVVRAAKAELKEIQPHRRVTGSLRAVARGKVAALEEGRILEITVREGAAVQAGDIIARVDARRLEAQRAELLAAQRTTQAQIAQRQAELIQTQRDLARTKRLLDSRAVTVEEHQHQETQVAVAEAMLRTEQSRLAENQSQLELLEVRLADMVVRAPYDGRVVQRHAEPGEWIRAGEPFVTLVSSGKIEAWLDVPERYVESMSGGTLGNESPLAVDIGGGKVQVEALTAKLIPDVNARTRTFPIVLVLDDQQGLLSPGMSVDTWIPVGAKERQLTVPKDAIVRNGHRTLIFKAVTQGDAAMAVELPIRVAFETGNLAVVAAEGLEDGDTVIIEGNERLIPGAPVIVATPEESLPQTNRLATSKR